MTQFSVGLLVAIALSMPLVGARGVSRDRSHLTPAQRKIASDLLDAIKRDRGDPPVSPRPPEIDLDQKGRALIDLRAEVTDALLAQIKVLGGDVISAFPEYQAVRARMPLKKIEALAERAEVKSIRLADKAEVKRLPAACAQES
jgi:hypothetical protein